jgi:hypothetical protein
MIRRGFLLAGSPPQGCYMGQETGKKGAGGRFAADTSKPRQVPGQHRFESSIDPSFRMHLKKTLDAWSNPDFDQVAIREIRALNPNALPLQQGLTHSGTVSEEGFDVRIIGASLTPNRLLVKAGLFYSGIIAGCSCSDDPSPVEPIPEYCEVVFAIDRDSGSATVELEPD